MALDPQAQAVIDQRVALGLPPLNTLTPAEARTSAEARPLATGPDVGQIEDRSIPGPAGQIPVRIYTPPGAGPFPALVYFHGGGWVVGTLDMSDGTCRHLCLGGECIVVSVDYRLAPEAKFPLPAEECYSATWWVAENGPDLNIDPARIAVGGGSAGGNLATVVALMARDRGRPPIAFQLLVYPVTDRNFETVSYRENGKGYMLDRDGMMWYWSQYLNDPSDASNPYAAPLQASDLSALPPALIITAEYDPLRDEGEAYASRLRAAGVQTTCTRYDGMIHGFFGMHDAIDKAKEAVSEASAALRRAFVRLR
ncbi:MAG: alpha/beta hydrolase [Dehalococcoidia bacterium]